MRVVRAPRDLVHRLRFSTEPQTLDTKYQTLDPQRQAPTTEQRVVRAVRAARDLVQRLHASGFGARGLGFRCVDLALNTKLSTRIPASAGLALAFSVYWLGIRGRASGARRARPGAETTIHYLLFRVLGDGVLCLVLSVEWLTFRVQC